MTKEEKVQYWTDLSDRELATAELLVKGKQYLWAGFMCHQVIEKIFKAYYSALTDETPPFIHDLRLLAVKADFWQYMTDEQQTQIREIMPLQIEARYPEYKDMIAASLTKERLEQIIVNTKQLQQWTKSRILSVK
ncbi:MAG: HEPN domain-containing protein [Dysgonamonadaceae bacterium]|jgi:HEPN domain-containing protein|nr:HEPN domain-containing protein [Dysgonamonadaceae bacterium]